MNMMTSSNGNIFRVTGHLCGEFTGPGEFPAQRPVTRSFDIFFEQRVNKGLSKQSWGWWCETLSRPLWRHCSDTPGCNGACITSSHICGVAFHIYIKLSWQLNYSCYLWYLFSSWMTNLHANPRYSSNTRTMPAASAPLAAYNKIPTSTVWKER